MRYSGLRSTEEECVLYRCMECHLTWSTLADPAGLVANLGCDAGCMVCLMLYVGLQSLLLYITHKHTHIHESVSNHCNGGSNLTKRGQVSK